MNTPSNSDTKLIQEQVKQFFAQYPPRQLRAGHVLIQPDDSNNHIHFLEDGAVKTYAINPNGDESVVNIYRASTFFPMSVAINQTANPFYYETISDSTIRLAPMPEVVAWLKSQPDVLFDLLSRVYRGTDGLLLRITFLLAGHKYANLIAELIITAKRFGTLAPDRQSVLISINQKDIAAQSGMARETVSREMRRLKDKGLISFDNHIVTIPDLERLEAELYSLE